MPSAVHSIISNQLWDEISPLLPESRSKRRLDDRRVLEGIVYVLSNGIAWYDLPLELGYGSGMTCWRRLRDWHARGIWDRIQKVLARELPGQVNFARIVGGVQQMNPPPRRKHRRIRTSFLGAAPAAGHFRSDDWTHHGQFRPHHSGSPHHGPREHARPRGAAVPTSPFAQ